MHPYILGSLYLAYSATNRRLCSCYINNATLDLREKCLETDIDKGNWGELVCEPTPSCKLPTWTSTSDLERPRVSLSPLNPSHVSSLSSSSSSHPSTCTFLFLDLIGSTTFWLSSEWSIFLVFARSHQYKHGTDTSYMTVAEAGAV